MATLRVATWNMNHWQRRSPDVMAGARDYLWRQVAPTVALLQETAPPHETRWGVFSGPVYHGQPWGTGVYSNELELHEVQQVVNRYSQRPYVLRVSHPGAIAIAGASLDETALVFVSMYGLLTQGYAQQSVLRMLGDLLPLFDSKLKHSVILGGDLNLSTQLPEPDRARHRALFDYMASLGLVDLLRLNAGAEAGWADCPCGDGPGCAHVQTHRHRSNKDPHTDLRWHNDYLFASKRLASRVTDCRALNQDGDGAWVWSDHCPVMAELDF